MRTELFTVSRIFTECLYRIPDYQRGYSWSLDQLRDFWLDLEQLNESGKHYTGVLTLERVPEDVWQKWEDDAWIIKSRHYTPYHIVDGQQRLTTVVVLIQALLEENRPQNLNFTSQVDVRRKYIFDSKPGAIDRSYIFGYEKDNPSYEFLKTKIFLEQSEVHLPEEDTIYTKNLLAAKDFFKDQLRYLDDSQVEELYTKVTQGLVFNVYEIAEEIDVFVTFETMNNRGKALSTLEILKNRLIYLSTKLNVVDSESKLRKAINEAWKSAYHYLGRNKDRPLNDDTFLRTQVACFYLQLASNAEGDDDEPEGLRVNLGNVMENVGRFLLNDLFTPKRLAQREPGSEDDLPNLTAELIFEYSQHLKSCVQTYYHLSTPDGFHVSDEEQLWLERMGRLMDFNPSPLLVVVYQREKNAAQRAKLLEVMERFYFVSALGTNAPYRMARRWFTHSPFVRYASGLASLHDIIQELGEDIDGLLKENSLIEQLRDSMSGLGFYGWQGIRYFLYEYELHLQKIAKLDTSKIKWSEFVKPKYNDDYMSIEHIFPQRPRDKYWTDRFSSFTASQKKALRNSLGNLLALSMPRNSSLSNKPFPEKCGQNILFKTGYRYGSLSENEVSFYEEWGPQEILGRGLKLLGFLEKRWGVSLGDERAKLRALGLEFLNPSGDSVIG